VSSLFPKSVSVLVMSLVSPDELELNREFLSVLRDSTLKSYETPVLRFTSLGGEFPLTGDAVVSFIRKLTEAKTVTSLTVRKYVTALKFKNKTVYDQWAMAPSDVEKIETALRVADRVLPETSRERAPVMDDDTITALMDAVTVGNLSHLGQYGADSELNRHKETAVAILVGLTLCLRAGELINIRGKDIMIEKEAGALRVRVRLENTKTKVDDFVMACCSSKKCDQARKWCTAHRLEALKARMSSPLRCFPLVSSSVGTYVREGKKLLDYLKLEAKFTGHSTRRTGAQAMLRSNVISKEEAKVHARWKSDTSYARYTSEELKAQSGRIHKTIAKVTAKSLRGANDV
jgi:integrase